MAMNRRDFLKTGVAGSLLLPIGAEAETQARRFPLHKKVMEGRSVCPYCSVGCGLIIATDSQGHVGVPASVSPVGHDVRMSVPVAPRRFASNQNV